MSSERDAASSDLVEVHLLEVPVPLWTATREHTEALQREFALVEAELAVDDDTARPVPHRLLELMTALRAQYSRFSSEQEDILFAAADAGQPVVDDLAYRVPPQVSDASRALGAMLDEADDYCRSGEHLLTLAASDAVVRFRRWFLDEFARQVAGHPPVPWPQYDVGRRS